MRRSSIYVVRTSLPVETCDDSALGPAEVSPESVKPISNVHKRMQSRWSVRSSRAGRTSDRQAIRVPECRCPAGLASQ
jgi:hypothetical protein